jgi:hypothetical protein
MHYFKRSKTVLTSPTPLQMFKDSFDIFNAIANGVEHLHFHSHAYNCNREYVEKAQRFTLKIVTPSCRHTFVHKCAGKCFPVAHQDKAKCIFAHVDFYVHTFISYFFGQIGYTLLYSWQVCPQHPGLIKVPIPSLYCREQSPGPFPPMPIARACLSVWKGSLYGSPLIHRAGI